MTDIFFNKLYLFSNTITATLNNYRTYRTVKAVVKQYLEYEKLSR